ncbi:helix-turn-helix domain-containing protein [Sphingomonas oligophenolica]|uniref:Helix-turn-helix domain-containing protein n=1 Tax=Sphingomonas oligophenolica TaxID=301154 RepID=A0ABU9Y6F3_9SPHN
MSPADFLKRKMALSGLSATALAKELKVHVQTLYNVTTGKRPISSALALKLAKRFNAPADVWLAESVEVNLSDVDDALTAKRAKRNGRVDGEQNLPLFAGSPAAPPRVDRVLIDRDIERLLQTPGGPVSVTPYDPGQVQPASYDLTVGIIIEKGFRELSEHEWVLVLKRAFDAEDSQSREADHVDAILKKKGGAVVWSKSVDLDDERRSVVVLTRELVGFEKEYLAEVGSTATNAMHGLLVNHGFQIDPGYSGPIIVTAMNIGNEPYRLSSGDKIVSLAIRELAEPPERAYRADLQQKIVRIFHRVDEALKSLFVCRPLIGGKEFVAESEALKQTHVAGTEDDALNKAVSAVMEALSKPIGDDPVHRALDAAVRNVLNSVSIDKQEAKALVRHFSITDEKIKAQAMRYFAVADDRQTIGATLERLQQDPIVALLTLTDG